MASSLDYSPEAVRTTAREGGRPASKTPIRDQYLRNDEDMSHLPKMKPYQDIPHDAKGADVLLAYESRYREQRVALAETSILAERMKACMRASGHNARRLCEPLIKEYVRRIGYQSQVMKGFPEDQVIQPDTYGVGNRRQSILIFNEQMRVRRDQDEVEKAEYGPAWV
jgi:hypothetical protein